MSVYVRGDGEREIVWVESKESLLERKSEGMVRGMSERGESVVRVRVRERESLGKV